MTVKLHRSLLNLLPASFLIILFIAGGAFEGLDKIIMKRMHHHPIGFGAEIPKKNDNRFTNIFHFVQQEDLLKFGFIPEMIGRLPVLAPLEALTEDALLEILTTPKNALVKQYRKLFAMEGVELDFEEGALKVIVRKAQERGIGARALRSIMEDLLSDLMFSLPDDKVLDRVIITREFAEGRSTPAMIRAGKKAA